MLRDFPLWFLCKTSLPFLGYAAKSQHKLHSSPSIALWDYEQFTIWKIFTVWTICPFLKGKVTGGTNTCTPVALVQESLEMVFGISGHIHCGCVINPSRPWGTPPTPHEHSHESHNPYTLPTEEEDLRTTTVIYSFKILSSTSKH